MLLGTAGIIASSALLLLWDKDDDGLFEAHGNHCLGQGEVEDLPVLAGQSRLSGPDPLASGPAAYSVQSPESFPAL